MDLKIGLSILLLLAHTSLSSSKPDNPPSSWRRYRNNHRSHLVNHQPPLLRRQFSQQHQQQHRHHRPVAAASPRRVRALSEFLLPPPVGGPSYRPASASSLKPASSQLLPVVHSRQGRVVQQQHQQKQQQQQESKPINYLSRLMNLLNPFAKDDDDDDDDIVDNHPGPADYPRLPLPPPQIVAQYAPQMPYVKREHTFTTTSSYYPSPAPIPVLPPSSLPPHQQPSSIAKNYHTLPAESHSNNNNNNPGPWAAAAAPAPAASTGKSCNACNKVPWVPIIHNNLYSNPTGQYAPNAGHIVTSGYVATSSYQVQTDHHQSASPPLSPTSFKSNSPGLLSTEYGAPPAGQFSSQNYEAPPQFSNGDGHGSSQDSFNHGPPQDNYNHGPPPPDINNNNNNNFNHQSSGVSISDHHQSPPSSFGNSGESFDGIELDHPPPDYHNQDSSNLDYEQHHQSSDLIGVVKEPAPSDSNDQLHGQEPEHAESRPVVTNNNNDNLEHHHHRYFASSTTSPPPIVHVNKNTLTVHFQRSPIIDLSVAGISTATPSTTTTTTTSSSIGTRRPIYQRSPPTFEGKSNHNNNNNNNVESTKPRLEASLIDYIVSGPRESFASSERKTVTGSSVIIPISRTTTTTSTRRPATTIGTTTTTTTIPSPTAPRNSNSIIVDQKQQGSIIETLVQSYGSREQSRDRSTDSNASSSSSSGGQRERELLTRPYKDAEDYSGSASREVVVPHKDSGKNNKQIIQIIIPYTSQYTPSPFHPTHAINGHAKNFASPSDSQSSSSSSSSSEEIGIEEIDDDDSNSGVEDNVLIEESRRVSVTHGGGTSDKATTRRNRPTPRASSTTTSTSTSTTTTTTSTTTTTTTTEQPPPAFLSNNAIDVHRLQKNIDNWTIQEYAKSTKLYSKHTNLTYPRWLSSKQIPDEYLVSAQGEQLDDSNEYYDYSNETEQLLQSHRWSNRSEINATPESSTKVNIINATYPRKPKTQEHQQPSKHLNDSKSHDSERVYVVTPVPNPNSLETDLSAEGKQQQQQKGNYERAYQVLPQAVNNLAVLVNAPESAAPALWGIMEHEEIPASPNQPRWRSESDVLSEPISTPILYGGHSKVSRAR